MLVPSFVGGSNQRDLTKANPERTIGWFPSIVEGAGKAPAILEESPGLVLFASLGAEIRGAWEVAGRVFVVAGSQLVELFSDGSSTARGSLSTATGVVQAAEGLLQFVMVDGPNGYVLRLGSNSFTRITNESFYGSPTVDFLDGRFYFQRPDTQQFYWTAIDDAADLNALDFASAERKPDNLVRLIVSYGEVLMLGAKSGEVWTPTASADLPIERNNGAVMEVGCGATHSVRKLDSTVLWLGNDENGAGMVWMLEGYKPVPVSNDSLSRALMAADISQASAFTFVWGKQSFYCLNAPGLETTWVFNTATRQWHELAELVNGEYRPWRVTCHAYAFAHHLVGGSDGKVYRLDRVGSYAGDVKVRSRTFGTQSDEWQFFADMMIDAEVGVGTPEDALLQMRYSNDGGRTWSAWRTASLGAQGQYRTTVKYRRLGRARHRVWEVRCTDPVTCSLISARV